MRHLTAKRSLVAELLDCLRCELLDSMTQVRPSRGASDLASVIKPETMGDKKQPIDAEKNVFVQWVVLDLGKWFGRCGSG